MTVQDVGEGDVVVLEESEVLHRTRAEAQRAIDLHQARQYLNPGPSVHEHVILPVNHVYLARCGECGDYPDEEYKAFRDWDQIADYTRSFPGWLATSECALFCPRHLPTHAW
ncbi:hypothetical protein ABZ639_22115 [Saccharomonospora sp. NPDC006951]